MEPLSPVKLTEFSRVLLVSSERIFDMPKSPTRALISSARRMLLGLRSQWITGGWHWLWRYSRASMMSTAMSSLWARLSVLLRVCTLDAGCSQSFRLPFGMNSKTSALNSSPWWLMLEQQVMIFMRQRWRTLRSASHSATKLLVDPDCRMLNTFTAVVIPWSCKVHL